MPAAGFIWLTALALYGLFRAWYDNWRGPLKPAEVQRILQAMQDGGAGENNDLTIVRKFLEADDGREFFMLNLVKLAAQAPNPDTGAPERGQSLMQRYAQPFMRGLLARGGHPALVARPVGGYVDAWNAAPDPGWTVIGYMRYRSRRDMAIMASHPRFAKIHKFKLAATAETFSFPTRPMLMLLLGPRTSTLLVLALAAALAHLALLTFGG